MRSQDLKIKIRNYPLVGGMEAVYTIWSGQTSPEGWQLAAVELSKPQFDDWGGEPNLERRYITFRTVTNSNANVRLSIDHIVAVDQTFTWVPAQQYRSITSPRPATKAIRPSPALADTASGWGYQKILPAITTAQVPAVDQWVPSTGVMICVRTNA